MRAGFRRGARETEKGEAQVPYRDLLVHLDAGPDAQDRLGLALSLAHSFEAHLTALCLVGEPFVPLIELPPEALYRARLEAEADGVLASAVAWAARDGVVLATRRETAALDRLPDRLAQQVRYADLAILGQADPDDPTGTSARLVEAAFLAGGRPVLVVPHAGRPTGLPAQRILAAWDGSREATRALHDALPLLERAARVVLVVVDPDRLRDKVGEVAGADIVAHLARHGIAVELSTPASGGLTTGEVLLAKAADEAAELLVMGGYGHARLRELVLGGTTRYVLKHMRVPVLLSH